MNKQDLIKMASYFVENSEDNIISEQIAVSEKAAGTRIFDAPIFGFGAADDEYFQSLKDPSVIGKHFLLPKEWLPQAKTVISFFLPFTEAVKDSNSQNMSWPSDEWMHGRIEGQVLIGKLCHHLQAELQKAGYNSVVPCYDKGYWARSGGNNAALDSDEAPVLYTSNWSERHVALVCGLGTFGLSKGLITKKGIAGRLGSIVTELYLSPEAREYETIYEYCSMCGTCVKNCPVSAISLENGKDHPICSDFLDETMAKHKPRYGCGKCQIKVPCASAIPKKLK